jgi:hypothetical protein
MVSGRGYDPVDIVHKQKSRVHAACKKWVQAACKKWFQAACKKCLTKKIYSSKITFQVISKKCDDGTMPFWGTLQRAGGWCEPVWNRLRSLLPEQIS